MHRIDFLSTLFALFAFASPAVAALGMSPQGDDVVVRALDTWLKTYERGKLDLVDLDRFKGKPRNKKDYVSVRLGIIEESRLSGNLPPAQQLNHERELRELCSRAADLGTDDAVDALLAVAEVGLDGKRVAFEQMPGLVRGIGDEALSKVRKGRDRVRAVAKELDAPTSLAALRALGWFKDEKDRPLLVETLEHEDLEFRRAAIEGLSRSGLATAIEPLADHSQRETNEVALAESLDAIADIVRDLEDPAKHDRATRRATTSAIRVLGQHSWQVDQSALDVLEMFRSADTVPALIGVLQRYMELSDSRKLEKASGIVRLRAHELLLSLSGATFPKARPDQWQEWWDKVHDTFKVAEVTDKRPAAGETTTGTFFGIPVRGSHVLFICDFSGSMDFPSEEIDDGGQQRIKMEIARRELKGAVNAMAGDGRFNLVWFETKTGSWKPKLVEASSGNKKKFGSFLDKAKPGGGTNLWGGLKLGLNMKGKKTEGDSEKYDSHVDEIFVLSDGAPSVGDIVDPAQILAAVRDANRHRRVRINTVFVPGPEDEKRTNPRGLPPPFDMKAPELMERLARENGGIFIQPGETRVGGG